MSYFDFRDKMQIDFHNADRLKKVVHSHLVSSHRPGRLCTASSSMLLYEDQSKDPREVRWLNCSTSPPKPANFAAGACSTHTQQDIVWDMCCVKHEHEKLVVTTKGYQGVYAYNTTSDKVQWHMKGKVAGMKQEICAEALTTDGLGHLFVCDRDNECIQIFTVDGTYMGPLLKERRQSLEQPLKLRWNKFKISLVIAHTKHEHYAISVIPVDTDDLDSLNSIQDEEKSIDTSPAGSEAVQGVVAEFNFTGNIFLFSVTIFTVSYS